MTSKHFHLLLALSANYRKKSLSCQGNDIQHQMIMEKRGRKWKQNTALKMPKNELLNLKCILNMSKNELKAIISVAHLRVEQELFKYSSFCFLTVIYPCHYLNQVSCIIYFTSVFFLSQYQKSCYFVGSVMNGLTCKLCTQTSKGATILLIF